ncbi:MAG: diphthamide biosynthesis enzyme Dph2, partial [Candidatus Diapherotrites archaeon]|nr:diphthamide biosynthesis enzyme Dph2 [Candidatus Diapherotrites archaeon]
KAKKILLQIPEGLKTKVEGITKDLEAEGFEVITTMDPTFGACDIKSEEAKQLGCDALLHLGHNAFVEGNDFPVVYAPLAYKLTKIEEFVEKLAEKLNEKGIKKVGVVTTIQFVDYLPKIRELLLDKKIGSVTSCGKRVCEGQVLGCNYSAVPNEDVIVYIGDGFFHPLGVHFATGKEVITANPLTLEIGELDKEKNDFLRKRILLIEKAKEANSYAILVTTKQGQSKISLAEKVKKELISSGKKAEIYVMDFISEEKLLGIKVGAYISTACPRLSIDDFASYKKPMINAFEVKYLLGESYDDYKLELVY